MILMPRTTSVPKAAAPSPHALTFVLLSAGEELAVSQSRLDAVTPQALGRYGHPQPAPGPDPASLS